MRGMLAAVVLAGCYQPVATPGAPCTSAGTCPDGLACEGGRCVVPGTGGDAAIESDAPAIDGPPPDACVTFSQQLDTCAAPFGGPLVLSGDHTYDTDTHELRTSGSALVPVTRRMVTGPAGPIDVILTTELSLSPGSTLRVTGSVPFGVAAHAVSIDGTIDASAGGAGARSAGACGGSAGHPGSSSSDGAGGGGGGGFRAAGGAGGTGDTNGATPSPGGAAGSSTGLPTGPRGGCPGGRGGNGMNNTAGVPGAGGGAIYLVSATSLTISGVLQAGGGGGGGGLIENGGGGGGGSGGMILLEAPSVVVSGTLAANGGGGGGGGSDNDAAGNPATPGDAGMPGRPSASAATGGGGGDSPEGGDGGAGGAGTSVTGKPPTATPDNAAGGGGGGCGYISIASPMRTTPGVISPALTPWP